MAPNFKEAQTVEGLYCTSVPTHLFQFVKLVASASFHLALSQRVTNLIHPRFLFSLSSTALCLPDLVPHLSILFPLLFLVEIAIGERLTFLGPSHFRCCQIRCSFVSRGLTSYIHNCIFISESLLFTFLKLVARIPWKVSLFSLEKAHFTFIYLFVFWPMFS